MNDLDTVFNDDWPEDHRSGVVAVVGRPNVGKSTLINRILGQKIAIVTPKPQTTRKQQLGIYSEAHGQILFVDTPGLHRPQHKLGQYMVEMAQRALRDADLILWVLDISEPPQTADKHIAETLNAMRQDAPVILALNKADLLQNPNDDVSRFTTLIRHEKVIVVSAAQGTGIAELVQNLLERLPLGPRYYPTDQVSEVNWRFIAAEVIREKAILHTEQEIPHAVAVEVDSFQERDDQAIISAIIYVEKESQKGIVIGEKGRMIKRVGSEARQDLIDMLGMRVHLDLRVKVLKNWRSSDKLMQRLGYRVPKDEER